MNQYIVVFDTGRFGDWRIVEASSAEDALLKVRRSSRRKIAYVRRAIRTSERGTA